MKIPYNNSKPLTNAAHTPADNFVLTDNRQPPSHRAPWLPCRMSDNRKRRHCQFRRFFQVAAIVCTGCPEEGATHGRVLSRLRVALVCLYPSIYMQQGLGGKNP